MWYSQEFLSPCPRYHVGGTVVHLDIGMRGQMSQFEKKLLLSKMFEPLTITIATLDLYCIL